MPKQTGFLIAGDVIAILVVTLIGFATHGETNLSVLPRMLATFLPLLVSWFLAAASLRLFEPDVTLNPRQLWRPLAAMLFAGPLAALLRAFWLGSVVIPIFGLVLTGSAGLGMLLWRSLWYLVRRAKKTSQ
jgi:hypothetical protein